MNRRDTYDLRTPAEHGIAVALVVALAFAVRAWPAWNDHGVFWPDEIFQTVEQGHRLAFGVGLVPWEFVTGARSWLFPGLVGGLLKLGASLGLDDGLALMRLVKLTMAALGATSAALAARLGRKLGGPLAALLAAVACAAFPASIVFDARCMTEVASAPMLLGASLLALSGSRRRAVLAGALAGLAVFVRVQNGVAVAGLLVLVFARGRSVRRAGAYLAGCTGAAIFGGALDAWTWGKPFHSVIEYVKFNLIQGNASRWGTAPWTYYGSTVWSSTGWAAIVLGVGFVTAIAFGAWPARLLGAIAALFVGIHCLVPHKEYRFLMPIVPLTLTVSGVGLAAIAERVSARLGDRWQRPLDALVAVALGGALVVHVPKMTHAQMGKDVTHANGQRSVWHLDEAPNLALAMAGRQADLCGVAFPGHPLVYTGGFSYLHRNVPLLAQGGSDAAERANYWLLPRDETAPDGYAPVRDFGEVLLVRRDGPCRRVEPDDRRLP